MKVHSTKDLALRFGKISATSLCVFIKIYCYFTMLQWIEYFTQWELLGVYFGGMVLAGLEVMVTFLVFLIAFNWDEAKSTTNYNRESFWTAVVFSFMTVI